MEQSLEMLARQATAGDQEALEEIIRRIQDRVYALALRMLWHPADAEDATQEVLVRIVTNLGSFRGDSAFTTWVYRVASNYMLTTRKRRAERGEVTFVQFGEQLDEGLSDEPIQVAEAVEHKLLIEEVRVGCTHGMLLCLDRDHRLAYILGEIVEVTGEEGGYILDITPVAFRKRLSRARTRILEFMQKKCGIFNPDNPCRCARRVDHATHIGRVVPQDLLFARPDSGVPSRADLSDRIHEIDKIRRAAAIYRNSPAYATAGVFVERLKGFIESQKMSVLDE